MKNDHFLILNEFFSPENKKGKRIIVIGMQSARLTFQWTWKSNLLQKFNLLLSILLSGSDFTSVSLFLSLRLFCICFPFVLNEPFLCFFHLCYFSMLQCIKFLQVFRLSLEPLYFYSAHFFRLSPALNCQFFRLLKTFSHFSSFYLLQNLTFL
jgi:hypothetical protein